MKTKMNGNLLVGMAKCHSGSVETLAIKGMHQPLSDVISTNLHYGREDDGVCPERKLKGHHSRLIAVFLTSRSPFFRSQADTGGLVNQQGKGV